MKYIITFALAASLFAGMCYAAGELSLAQQLQGQSAEKQHETLRLACLNRAEKITGKASLWKKSGHGHVPVRDSKVEQMKQLCREMSEAFAAPQQDGESPAASKLQLLDKKCNTQLNRLSEEGAAQESITPMREVCLLMTAA